MRRSTIESPIDLHDDLDVGLGRCLLRNLAAKDDLADAADLLAGEAHLCPLTQPIHAGHPGSDHVVVLFIPGSLRSPLMVKTTKISIDKTDDDKDADPQLGQTGLLALGHLISPSNFCHHQVKNFWM
jgi:hypothetical protein